MSLLQGMTSGEKSVGWLFGLLNGSDCSEFFEQNTFLRSFFFDFLQLNSSFLLILSILPSLRYFYFLKFLKILIFEGFLESKFTIWSYSSIANFHAKVLKHQETEIYGILTQKSLKHINPKVTDDSLFHKTHSQSTIKEKIAFKKYISAWLISRYCLLNIIVIHILKLLK